MPGNSKESLGNILKIVELINNQKQSENTNQVSCNANSKPIDPRMKKINK